MVVAQEPLATDVGVAVLKSGGNAVDAAIAVGFALAVTHPTAGNLGGGGFMLIRLANGKTTFLDFREAAPKKASRNMYLDAQGNPTKDSLFGWRAPGVPGSVKGFEAAHRKFGKKTWAELLQPAIKLAHDGFRVSPSLQRSLSRESSPLQKDLESRRIFLRDGTPYQEGELLRQAELAATLERIAKYGAKDFYRGETAKKFAAAMVAHGGLITLDDLKRYRVKQRKPLHGHYKNYDILTAPPPSAGGVGLLQMLGMVENSGYSKDGPGAPSTAHYIAEVMRRFYADRSEYLGDPDYYKVPVRKLLDPDYISARRQSIDPLRASSSNDIGPGLGAALASRLTHTESTETTHYNVVDAQGNAVAVTYTLNGSFGSGVTVPGLGFLLNNEMDDFVAKPGSPNMFGLVGGEANAIQPGKRPLSSMTPTIITENGKLSMVVGAPGGSRITNGVFQVILNVLDFHMNAQDAVDAPRLHHQWKPDTLFLEKGFDDATTAKLAQMGYTLKPITNVARVEVITVKDGTLAGGTESQSHGKAAGY